MRKKILTIIVLLATYSCLIAQPHYVSVGLRGGAGSYLAAGGVLDNRLAANFMVDAGYTYFWPVDNVELGIHTGLSFGYTGGRYRMALDEQYRNIDYLGHPMDYTITAESVQEKVNGFTMEIPAMFAFRWNGMVMNAGMKLQVPMYYRYHQQLSSTTVQAYYPDYDVTVVDEKITGIVDPSDYAKSGRRDIGNVSLLLGLELGYEWQLTPSDMIGLMGYLDGALYSHPAGQHTEHVVDVAPISNAENPVPAVDVNTIVGTYATRLNYLDFGVKVYYRFDVLHYLNK